MQMQKFAQVQTIMKPIDLCFGLERQRDYYQGKVPINWPPWGAWWEKAAGRAMRRHHGNLKAWDYLTGGAGLEQSMQANRKAFDLWAISPRAFVNVANATLATPIKGTDELLPAPVLLAPIGFQALFDVQNKGAAAELAVAEAAGRLGIPVVVSCLSTKPIEAIKETLGKTPCWFQLYWHADEKLAKKLVTRVEACGCEALVLTGDTPCQGWKIRDLTNRFPPFKSTPVNFGREKLPSFIQKCPQPRVDWQVVKQLVKKTRLPVFLKGIMNPQDARLAKRCGATGVIVSNHGGRQIDGEIGALTALPDIADALGNSIPILFDSGIRTGPDIFKALALGAQAVLIGRPYIYGLIVGGAQGVDHILRDLLAELVVTVAAAGHPAISTINRKSVKRL